MQAARGAALTVPEPASGHEAGPEPAEGTSHPTGRRRAGLLVLVALLALAADLATKLYVVAELEGRRVVDLGVLQIAVSRNSGAAFSFAEGATLLFTAVAGAVVVVILRTARRLRSAAWAVALGLLLGGATGNLLDRLFRAPGFARGAVVDFLDFRVWPVFNLADSAIVCGGVLAVLLSFRGVELDGTRAEPGRGAGREGHTGGVTDRREVPVPEGLDGLRLDAAISRLFGISRTSAASIADAGGVSVDGRRRGKGDRIAAGATLAVDLPSPDRAPAPPAEVVEGLRVLHEDDDVVVVDKPVGVAAHPSPGWEGPTVIGGLAAAGHRVSTSGAEERQGVVHRLDVGTSGVMVVAKSEHAYTVLKDAFRHRTVDKRYRALVQGHPDPMTGTIDAPIDRHPTSAYRFAVVQGGKDSVTHYETVEAFRHATLLDIHLETGRTHQIRVHMSAVKHPCVGDLQYGADPTLSRKLGLGRQWLHAVRLGFHHPADGRWVEFESPYAPDLQAALEKVAGAS